MLLRPLALLALTAPLLAEEPTEQLVDELAELREQVTGSEGMVSDRADFAEALRRVAGREGRAAVVDSDAQTVWNGYSRPGLGERHPERLNGYEGPPGQPMPTPQPMPPRHAGWGTFAQPQDRPSPMGPRLPRPEKALLLETAFGLERMAHGLEMADLVGEADSVRHAAMQLRQSARKIRPRTEAKPPRPPRPRSAVGLDSDPPTDAAEATRRRRWEDMPRLNPNATWMDRAGGRRGKRAPNGKKEPAERRPEEGLRAPAGPLPGVHGGPTEPPKAEDE